MGTTAVLFQVNYLCEIETMNKNNLKESDIRTKFITPAIIVGARKNGM
jgi:hypothetical protein